VSDDIPVNSRGHRDSRSKSHYTEPQTHPPYHFDHQNQPQTQEVQKPTSGVLHAQVDNASPVRGRCWDLTIDTCCTRYV